MSLVILIFLCYFQKLFKYRKGIFKLNQQSLIQNIEKKSVQIFFIKKKTILSQPDLKKILNDLLSQICGNPDCVPNLYLET